LVEPLNPTIRRSFARSYAPNEQFLWPETAMHDVGWLVKAYHGDSGSLMGMIIGILWQPIVE
jgi:hypothetical protein